MVPKGHAETLKTLSLDGYMVVIDTGVKGSTRQAVEDVHKLCEDPQYMSHVKHIGKLVLRASDVIEHHNFEALADIFNECHADLKALTVSHDKIEQLMKIGKMVRLLENLLVLVVAEVCYCLPKIYQQRKIL